MLLTSFHVQAAWFITKTAPSVIAFGDDGDSEIVAPFNVSSDQASNEYLAINFLEVDTCNTTTFADYLNGTVGTIADTDDDDYKSVSVGISIEKDTITESGAWSWTNDTNALLAFCTRVDLVTGVDFGGLGGLEGPLAGVLVQSVGYVKVMYSLDIDMSNNFEVSIAAEETEALTDEQTTTVTYNVNACQCTLGDLQCLDGEIPALTQNSLLNICVYPDQSDIIIRSVESFALQQGDLAVTFVTGDDVNALTTISPVEQQTVSISTVLISAFFLNPSPVTASGMVVLTFGNTDGRRQLSAIGSGVRDGRQMQDAEDGTGTFDVEATLIPAGEEAEQVQNIDESSAMLLSVFNGAVATFAMATAVAGLV